MMSALKKQPSAARENLLVALQLVFGVIAGVLLCTTWLVAKPVATMDTPPPPAETPPEPHDIIYVRGKVATRSNQGARKFKSFLDRTPGELVFIEEDINRWLSSAFGEEGQPFADWGEDKKIVTRTPSVRLLDDELQIGLELVSTGLPVERTIVVQARGRFVEYDGRQVFVPREMYVGSMPVPWRLGGEYMYQTVFSRFAIPENVGTAWAGVSRAVVEKNRLRLMMGPGTVTPSAPAMSTPSPAAPAPVAVAPETDSAAAPVTPTPEAPAESTPVPAAP